jgi:hypothetical protein
MVHKAIHVQEIHSAGLALPTLKYLSQYGRDADEQRIVGQMMSPNAPSAAKTGVPFSFLLKAAFDGRGPGISTRPRPPTRFE